MDIDENNNLYVSGLLGILPGGHFEGQQLIQKGGTYIAKYDSQNNFKWVKQISGLINPKLLYESNSIYVVGNSSLSVDTIFYMSYPIIPDYRGQNIIFRIDTNGTLDWSKKIIGNLSISINSSADHLYLNGHFQDTVIFKPNDTIISTGQRDGYIVKYNKYGNVVEKITSKSPTNCYIHSIDFDANNNIWVLGRFMGMLSVGGLNLNLNQYDDYGIIYKMNQSGIVDTSNYILWNEFCQLSSKKIRFDNNYNIFINGYYNNCLDIGPYYLDTIGCSDIFISKLNRLSNSNNSLVESKLLLYPNPASDLIHINSEEDLLSYYIFSSSGHLIESKLIQSHSIKININNLQPGLFFIYIMSNSKIYYKKFIKL
ncbi:MAG: hypothetical protein Kow0068_13250 [Marinilabiliales bacterium]